MSKLTKQGVPNIFRMFMLGLLFLCANSLQAQAPHGFSYQAVVRNSDGSLATNSNVNCTVYILRNSVEGDEVYVEELNGRTNVNGLLSLVIGTGTALTSTFDQIDWSTGSYYIKTALIVNGVTDTPIVGTAQLLSVPYALYATRSGDSLQGKSAYEVWLDSENIGSETEFLASLKGESGEDGSALPDADASTKGKLQLAGDLSGTSALPTIAINAVTTAKLATDAVETAKIKDAAVTVAKIKAGTDGQVLTTNGTGKSAWTTPTAIKVDDATIEDDATNGLQVKNTGITAAKLATDAVETAKIKDAAVTVAKIKAGTDGQVLTTNSSGVSEWTTPTAIKVDDTTIEDDATNGLQIKNTGITAAKLATDAVETAKIKDAAVTVAKIKAGTDGQVLTTNSSGVSEWTTPTAIKVDDATIEDDATNGLQVKNTGITAAKLATDAVETAKIKDAAVTVAKIKGGTDGQVLTTNSSGVSEWTANYFFGEIKQTIGSMPTGWIRLEGQAITTLTATQQTNATSLGLSGNLPNASNAYLSQNGTALGSISGSNSKTITQANLPNVNFTGTTSASGVHNHSLNSPYAVTHRTGGSQWIAGNTDTNVYYTKTGSTSNMSINNNGNHSHTVNVASGGSGTALNVTPSTLSVNTYIYLGE